MSLPTLTRREHALLALAALLAAAAILGPSVPGPGSAGSGAGAPWPSLPDALDALGLLPLAVLGGYGLRRLRLLDRADEALQDAAALPQLPLPAPVNALDCAWMFFAGLLLSALGAAFFHLQGDDLRLAADRAGMSLAFAGLVGLAVCERVSARAGWPAAWVTLGAGLLAAAVCHRSGNALPWAVLQYGGLALLLALALSRPVAGAIGLRLGAVLLFLAPGSLLALGDPAIDRATHQLLSGHDLQQWTLALAALPVLNAVQAIGRGTLRHNPHAAGRLTA